MITIDELADDISQGLPKWQRDANYRWLRNIHRVLKDRGTWIFPGQSRLFCKDGEGFREIVVMTPSDIAEEVVATSDE